MTPEEAFDFNQRDWRAYLRHAKTEVTETEPVDLDPECRKLCLAINRLPGVSTSGSCCGHGLSPFQIWLKIDPSVPQVDRSLAVLSSAIFNRMEWRISLGHLAVPPVAVFVLEGPVNADGDRLAREILTYLITPERVGHRESFDKMFGPFVEMIPDLDPGTLEQLLSGVRWQGQCEGAIEREAVPGDPRRPRVSQQTWAWLEGEVGRELRSTQYEGVIRTTHAAAWQQGWDEGMPGR